MSIEEKDSMGLRDKAQRIAEKLLEETRNGNIEWAPFEDTSFLTAYDSSVVDLAFSGDYKGKSFAVYEEARQVSYDGETYYWDKTAQVALIEKRENAYGRSGKLLWQFPATIYTQDLFQTVRLKGFKVEESLNDILDEDFC